MPTDDFNRADGAPGSNWTTLHGSGLSISSNGVVPAGANYVGMFWNADAFADDQYSEAVRVSGGNFVGVSVRCSGNPGVMNWYTWFAHGSLQKAVSGVVTTINGSVATFSNGDTARIVVAGTSIELFKNGVSQGSYSDASLSSGSAGLVFFNNGDGPKADDWEGGDGGGGGGAGGGALVGGRLVHSVLVGGRLVR